MEAKLLFLHALSPLHAGTGQGSGVIDLPIAREKATQIPLVPGSTVKGVFRDACEDESIGMRLFGSDDQAGDLTITDCRLLLFPVRSLAGIFAWVSSPLILRRFVRDLRIVESLDPPGNIPQPSSDEACLVSPAESELEVAFDEDKKVILEDFPLSIESSTEVGEWAEWLGKNIFPKDEDWKNLLTERFCIVSDNLLEFLLENSTEVTARIRIEDQKKTVQRGALWYEESLPTESVLVGLVVANFSKSEEILRQINMITQRHLQFGGNATVGRGLCRVILSE